MSAPVSRRDHDRNGGEMRISIHGAHKRPMPGRSPWRAGS
jgi:hypothetical protein